MLINKRLAKFDCKVVTELDRKVRPVVISRIYKSRAPEAEIQKFFVFIEDIFFSSKHQYAIIITSWLSLRLVILSDLL